MAPRTILYTGKGGVGKTSVAAATARRCAAEGRRTIVLSTDPAHSLADALEAELGPDPVAVRDRLWAQQVSAQEELERQWSGVRDWLAGVLVERGVDRISAEELTVPPGMDELFSLLQLKRHHDEDAFDVVVVDCAPTGETLRLLSFPDVARWWLEKVFPQRSQLMSAARPLARALLDVSLPGEEVLDDVDGLVRNLIAMNEILRDHSRASVRLVMTPDRMVIDEARRTFTYLNLYGYLTDAVVVQPRLPRRGGPVLRRVARAPGGDGRDGARRLRPGAGAARPVLRRGGRRRGDARRARRRAVRGRRRGRRAPRQGHGAARAGDGRRDAPPRPALRAQGRRRAEEARARARRARRRRRSAPSCSRRSSRTTLPRARAWTRACCT